MPHDRGAFTGDVPEPILVTRLVLARNQSEVAANCFGMTKAMWIIYERCYRFGRANAHSRDSSQLTDGGRMLCLTIQLLLNPSHLADKRLYFFEQKIAPRPLRQRGQGQLTEPRQLLFAPQPGCFGGTTPALRRSARTVFLARVRLAMTGLRQLISSRQVRTCSEGTYTVSVSPR